MMQVASTKTPIHSDEKVLERLAQEFIEERLGMIAKNEHISVFAQQISRFIQVYHRNFDDPSSPI